MDSTADNTVCNGHESHITKEEEVYQDLCSIQNLTRTQVCMHALIGNTYKLQHIYTLFA